MSFGFPILARNLIHHLFVLLVLSFKPLSLAGRNGVFVSFLLKQKLILLSLRFELRILPRYNFIESCFLLLNPFGLDRKRRAFGCLQLLPQLLICSNALLFESFEALFDAQQLLV